MKIEVTEEMISDWIKSHEEDYKVLINRKIDRAIKDAIEDAFQHGRWNDDGDAFKLVEDKANLIINQAIESYEIDTDEIKRKLTKQVNTKVKNLTINIC